MVALSANRESLGRTSRDEIARGFAQDDKYNVNKYKQIR